MRDRFPPPRSASLAAWVLLLLCTSFWGCGREDLDLRSACGGDQSWAFPQSEVRDRSPITRLIATSLDLKPGLVAWDLGAGAGYWSHRMTQAVGPTGRVFATDTNRSCVGFINQESDRWGDGEVHAAQVLYGNPAPIAEKADRILVSNSVVFMGKAVRGLSTHRGVSAPEVVHGFFEGLRPGGLLVYYRDFDSGGCMSAADLVRTFEHEGFKLLDEGDPQSIEDPRNTPEAEGQRCRTFAVFRKPA